MDKDTDLFLRKIGNREYRNLEFRLKENQENWVDGYATTFNQSYLLYESKNFKFYERVDSHAFDETDLSDVIFQFDHTGRVYARTSNNTLKLSTDSKGLKVEAYLGGTELGKQLLEEIRGNYINKMSYGYTVAEQKRESVYDADKELTIVTRTILKVKKVYDVSAVSLPANDYTEISSRNFCNGVIEEIQAERLERSKKIKKIKLLCEV